jgi:AraC-like DNA-binding protein
MFPQLNIDDNQLRKLGLTDTHIQTFNNVNKLTEKMLNDRVLPDDVPEYTTDQLRQKEHNERAIQQMELAIANYETDINKTIRTMNTIETSYLTQYEAYTELSDMISIKQREVEQANRKLANAENRKQIANRKIFYETTNMDIYKNIYYLVIYLIWVGLITMIFMSLANERFKKDVIFYAGIIAIMGFLPNIIQRIQNMITR